MTTKRTTTLMKPKLEIVTEAKETNMTNVLIERAENAWLLIIQDNTTGKRKVITVPFKASEIDDGYLDEADAVRLLMGIVVE